MSEGQQTMEA